MSFETIRAILGDSIDCPSGEVGTNEGSRRRLIRYVRLECGLVRRPRLKP